MKLCENCKAELKDEAVFCSKCGFRQEPMQGKENKKAGKQKRGKGGRRKYFVFAGVALVLVTAGFFGLMYISAKQEWKERTKVSLNRPYSPDEYYYLIGLDYSMYSGVYESNSWKWDEDKYVDEQSRMAGYTDARYDAKGRITERGLGRDTDKMNDVTYSYEENADGTLTVTVLAYATNLYMQEVSHKYIWVYDKNKELVSEEFYGKKQGQIGYEHVSSDTYSTLLKDGIYNDEYGWWETDDGCVIWITKGTEKEEIVWIVVLDSATYDYEMEEGVYCVTGGKSIQILDSSDISRNMERNDEEDTRSYLRRIFERVGYNEKGNPEIVFLESDFVEISYLDSGEKIKTVVKGNIWCDDGYEMSYFLGGGFGPTVKVPEEETIEEFIKTYMEEHRLTVMPKKKEQSPTSDQAVLSEEENPKETPASAFIYTIDDGEVSIERFSNHEITEVYIPKRIEGYPVTKIRKHAFSGCRGLTSVRLPDSVTVLGEGAFSGCRGLVTVEMPSSIMTIEDEAFKNCTKLTEIMIPNSVTSIGEEAFWGCTNLMSVRLPDSITVLREGMFSGCSGLATVKMPSSIMTIEDEVFKNCVELTKIMIPNTVTSIGMGTFSGCDSLAEIMIPGSVTSIGKEAFLGCTDLTSVRVSDGVMRIGERVFECCESLESIEIPESVTSIGEEAFLGCTNLKSVRLLASMTMLNKGIFSGCRELTTVKIPNSVTRIDDEAFKSCVKLTEIMIPNSVTSIGKEVFFGAEDVTIATSKGSYAERWAKENGYPVVVK